MCEKVKTRTLQSTSSVSYCANCTYLNFFYELVMSHLLLIFVSYLFQLKHTKKSKI